MFSVRSANHSTHESYSDPSGNGKELFERRHAAREVGVHVCIYIINLQWGIDLRLYSSASYYIPFILWAEAVAAGYSLGSYVPNESNSRPACPRPLPPAHFFFVCFWLKINLKQECLLASQNKIQTIKRFKRTLFIGTKHNLQMFGESPLSSYKTKFACCVLPQQIEFFTKRNLQVVFCPNK